MPDSQNEDNLKTAEALVKDGKAREAIPIYEETLANLEMLYGEEGLELADCLLGLGLAYDKAERLNDALRVYTRALRLARQLLGQPDEVVVDILVKLIDINESLGRPADALAYCQQAMDEAKACLPKNSRITQKIVDRYHHFANLAGKREEAMPLKEKKGKPSVSRPSRDLTGEGREGAEDEPGAGPGTDGSGTVGAGAAGAGGTSDEHGRAPRRPAPPPMKASRGRSLQEGDNKQATFLRLLKNYSLPVIGALTVFALVGFFVMHPPSVDPAVLLRNAAGAGVIDNLYRTADDSKKLRLTAKNEAILATGASGLVIPYVVSTPDCQGLLPALVSSLCEKQIWMDKAQSQIKSEDGTTYYAADGPEALVIAKMARLAGNAQGYFLRTGEFPKAVTPDMAAQYSYQNPLDGNESPVPIKAIIDDGSGSDNTQAVLESGNLIAGEAPYTACKIACYAVQSPVESGGKKRLKTIKFFVRGCDRDGKFITTPSKKVYVITPSDAFLNAPEPPTKPVLTRGGGAGLKTAKATVKGSAKGSGKASAKGAVKAVVKADEITAANSTANSGANEAPPLALELNVIREQPTKKTRMWIVANPPCSLIYIHYGLPILLFGLTIITFLWSRMTGSDMRGRTTASGNNFALVLSAICLGLSLLALAAEIVIFG